MLSKLFLYGLLLQTVFYSVILASEGTAQVKNVKEVDVIVNADISTLNAFFKDIERQTLYKFAYSDQNLRHDKIKGKLQSGERNFYEVLRELSKINKLKFKQVNNSISVDAEKPDEKEDDFYELLQEIDISGTITSSEDGEGLPGVNVILKGTSQGAVSDINGNYKIKVPSTNSVLVFSFVGFNSQEITVGNQSVIDVALSPDIRSLEEIVVVGYGVQDKSDLTGSVASINSEDFEQQPLIRTENALKGRTAGVTVQTPSGAPGASMKIRIRGFNSINGNNNPLYVIDGFIGADISTLNPNDIASMDVLKDASATAIYGSRGSNGVVIITTKSGKKGQLKIDFDAFYSADKISRKLDLLNAEEYMNVVNARNRDLNLNDVFTQSEIDSVASTGGTNWLDEILRTGATQNYQLALSGGTDKTRFYISGSMSDQEGIIKNSYYKRYGIRANLSSELTKKIDVDFNIYANHTFARNNYTYDGRGTALGAAHVFPPNIAVIDEATQGYTVSPGSYGPIAGNPVYQVTERLFDEKKWNTWSKLQLNYEIIEGLKFSVMGGVNGVFTHSPTFKRFQPGADESTSEAIQTDNFYYRLQNTNILNYAKKLGSNHKFDISAIYEQQITKSEGNYAYATGLTTNALTYYRLQLGANQQVSSGYSDETLQSFLGRVNYTFKDRYLFTASFRADGSSKFGEGNKYGYFPSAALAWRLSDEPFLNTVDFISDLKIRTSVGKVGSQAISPYQTLTTLALNQNYPFNNTSMSVGVGPGTPSNPDLKWETTTQYNVGIDYGILGGKVNGTIDYYHKETNDLLLNVPVPRYAGGGSVLKNIGSVENKGFEFLVNWSTIDHANFKLNTSFNLSINRNKILSLGEDSVLYIGNFILKPGEPISQFYGLTYEGTWKENEADEAAEFYQVPGDPRYRDVNGDKVIGNEDMSILGSPLPDFNWGWNTSIEYKNFDLNVLINGTQGNQVWNHTRFLILGSGDAIPTSKEILNRWTPENNQSDIPGFSATSNSRANSNQWIEDGSFIRIANVTLGYTIPETVLKNTLNRARFYISVQNLGLITNYSSYDPELSTTPLGSDTQQGIDNSTYPAVRTFTVGTKISL
ncbi:SusC/RagA family TonB-linked outer membrane protein [Chondrinema litorale]|uniref:SusC/RagA family TonB-linked outer membrane protein n=1 Tax=Chondrinema litorale TaxID=2994555 RepID=UPI002542C357|nr:TonB-dependent receptor [Chondrinema litorale]UZR95286.1 TonB-dependent receptor [Chondrinema litorale]